MLFTHPNVGLKHQRVNPDRRT